MTTHQNIFDELQKPVTAIAYRIGRAVKELRKDQHVLETQHEVFDLYEFAGDGHCELQSKPDLHQQIQSLWHTPQEALYREALNTWFDVSWQGHKLEVVTASWNENFQRPAIHWVIAESQQIAESFVIALCDWCSEVRGEVLVYTGSCWSKSRALFDAIQSARFDNLILRQGLKEQILDDARKFVEARATYERYRVPWKRGILLLGPPGNGKTHCAKALVNQLGLPCLYVQSFKSQHRPEHAGIHEVFQRARKSAPCIMLLEDLDSLITAESRSFFLNELDGFAENAGIITLATTNHPDRLDPAILERPSRFDMKYHFDLPGPAERFTYLEMWNGRLEEEMRIPPGDVEELASVTDNFSFAYLKELMLAAVMRWISNPEVGAMPGVLRQQVQLLRDQMSYQVQPAPRMAGLVDEDDF